MVIIIGIGLQSDADLSSDRSDQADILQMATGVWAEA